MSSGVSGRGGATRHPQPMWCEPALAHGSSYGHPGARGAAGPSPAVAFREMERGPALAPELDNDQAAAAAMLMRASRKGVVEEPRRHHNGGGGGGGFMKRMFERRSNDGGKALATTDNSAVIISAPIAPQKAVKTTAAAAAAAAAPLPPGYSPYILPRGPAPPRPSRPPIELSPAPLPQYVPASLAAAAAAKAAAQARPETGVVIRPENLGTAAQALGSNPVRAPELVRARKTYNRKTAFVGVPYSGGRLGGDSGSGSSSGSGCGSGSGSGNGAILEMHPGGRRTQHKEESLGQLRRQPQPQPQPPRRRQADGSGDGGDGVRGAEARAARRGGMVIDPASSLMTSFPEPAFGAAAAAAVVRGAREEQNKVIKAEVIKQRKQQQKALPPPPPPPPSPQSQPQPQPQPQPPTGIPQIVVTEPAEPAPPRVVAAKGQQLTADYQFRRLLRAERARARQVAEMWAPIGELLAAASDGAVEDASDVEALEGVLGQLADDSARYRALLPALDLLARDRRIGGGAAAAVGGGVGVGAGGKGAGEAVAAEAAGKGGIGGGDYDCDALARGLCDVLEVRNRAVAAAAHHKKKAKALEQRLGELAVTAAAAAAAADE